jgi:DNA repair protein RadA/Sms
VLLLGGDPGVGKSTLALQLAAQLASQSKGIGMGFSGVGPVWYVSGEETLTQVASRAERLDAVVPQLYLFAETNLNIVAEQVILETETMAASEDADTNLPPSLIIVDSLQTMVCDTASNTNYAVGGVAQVRECMALLLRLAKVSQIPILVIGHVTKSGDVAGPRMVEHMVDAVLYLEHGGGASSSSTSKYRWLRAVKNRFGSCDIVGLYSFESNGRLQPSPELLDNANLLKQDDLEGCAMSIAVEGNQRAMAVEVQALVTTTVGMVGKKTVDGVTYARLSLLLGVLQKHCGVYIGGSRDVFVNVISNASSGSANSKKGGENTSLDLALSVALTSSLASIPVRGDTAFLAQVGLLGELRPLPNMEARLMQAQRLGFSQAVVAGKTFRQKGQYNMQVIECPTLQQALGVGLTAAIPKRRSRRTKSATTNKPSPDDNVILDDDDYDDFE